MKNVSSFVELCDNMSLHLTDFFNALHITKSYRFEELIF